MAGFDQTGHQERADVSGAADDYDAHAVPAALCFFRFCVICVMLV
jgi:hypothetical protein